MWSDLKVCLVLKDQFMFIDFKDFSDVTLVIEDTNLQNFGKRQLASSNTALETKISLDLLVAKFATNEIGDTHYIGQTDFCFK